LTTAISAGREHFELLFSAEHPSRSLYFMEVSYSLLLPAKAQNLSEPNMFQVIACVE